MLIESINFDFCRSARDSKPLEVVGTYNPLPQRPTNLSEEEARVARSFKEVSIDRSRVKYWLGVGAQPTDSVWRLLSMVSRQHFYISMLAIFPCYISMLYFHGGAPLNVRKANKANFAGCLRRLDYLNPNRTNSQARKIDSRAFDRSFFEQISVR